MADTPQGMNESRRARWLRLTGMLPPDEREPACGETAGSVPVMREPHAVSNWLFGDDDLELEDEESVEEVEMDWDDIVRAYEDAGDYTCA